MRTPGLVAILPALLIFSTVSSAQVLEAPPRPEPGRPGRRSSPPRGLSPYTLRINLLGGFDDDMAAAAGTSSALSGMQAFSDVTFGYTLQHPTRSLETNVRAMAESSRDFSVEPSYGGEGDVRGSINLGQRSALDVAADFRYDRYLALGTWTAVGGAQIPSLPAANPTNSLTQQRALSTQTAVTIDRRWSRATITELLYAYSTQWYPDNLGYDGRTHSGGVSLNQVVGPNAGLRAVYRHSVGNYKDLLGNGRRTVTGTIHAGGNYAWDLSPTRRIAFTGGGGVSYVDTVRFVTLEPFRYWTPTGFAGVSMGLARSWSVAANLRRAPQMLNGLTTESYMSESASISLGGQFSPKVNAAFTLGYTDGTTDPARAVQLGTAQYDTYTGTAQVQFELTPWWSAVANYTHYQHHANPTASAALGVVPVLHRNAVRVGFTWSFPAGPRSARARE